MPVEIVTIVNSSGKIVSTGKHLFGVFKEAKACYSQKKASLKAEQAIKRAQTFDVGALPQYHHQESEYGWGPQQPQLAYDDATSQASSRRSHGSRRSKSTRKPRPALTENNLKTHTEVSATPPSRAPSSRAPPPPANNNYQSPYAETVGQDMAMSRPTLAPTAGPDGQMAMPIMYEDEVLEPYQEPYHPQDPAAESAAGSQAPISRSRSDPSMHKKRKSIDMDLAYGNIPPDLEYRTDLDPQHKLQQQQQYHADGGDDDEEHQAQELAEKIEGLLTEAQCAHHTATHIMSHLENNPDAAAAVALTLAELSAIVGKLSPSFLTILQGGSPAVFALLASPQFLIAAGLTVGVTVVMFGGLKIVKRIREAQEAAAAAYALPASPYYPEQQQPYHHHPEGEVLYEEEYYEEYDEYGQPFDEALVLEEELSSIESWRRGIPCGEDGSAADLELISPEAMRSQYGDDDARTERSGRTHKTSKTSKSSHKKKHRRSKSADSSTTKDAGSEAGSERTHRSSHRSHKSEKSEKSKDSKRSSRHTVKAIEDGSKDRENTIDMVIRPKKDNLLKSMFKKRQKEGDGDHKEKERVKVKSSSLKF